MTCLKSQTEQNPSQKRWQYQPLSHNEIQQIHVTSMRVLEEVGFKVQEPEAFELFKKAGVKVDYTTGIVRINESQIREIISSVPKEITLYGREPRHNLTLGSGNVYFGTGGTAMNVLEFDSSDRRPATLKDLIEIIRIVDQQDNIHLMLLPTYPNEIDVDDVDVNRFYAGMKYTSKHVMGGVYTERGIHDVIKVAEQIAGGPEALRERPFISMISCGISPLRLCSKYGRYTIQIARQGIPLAVPVEPLCGATAPITLAGTLVIQNCDGLINIMLTQLANPGTTVIYGSVATSVSLQDIRYLGGPIESGMLNAATAQLAQFYGFPYYSTAGISDSKTLDAQCGYESAMNNILVALAGGDFIHDAAGLMEFAVTVSKEKLVIDNEILGMVSRAVNGIEVKEKTLAFDEIRAAGPGGNFVSSRHTRHFMRCEHYMPSLTNREKRNIWNKNGRPTTAYKAHEIVKGILSQTPTHYIDQKKDREIIDAFPNIQTRHGKIE